MTEEKAILYTVGDSHSWHAWCKIPRVNTRSVGPMTMYRCGIDKPIVTGHIPPDAPVVFCWGEIDCRCHVHKFIPWELCIDELVAAFLEVVRINSATHPNIWIYNIVPPPRRSEQSEIPDAFPFLGTNEERLSYVRYMNKKLKESGRKFIDVYDQYADAEGYLNPAMSDDQIHVSNEKPLIEWMKKELGV